MRNLLRISLFSGLVVLLAMSFRPSISEITFVGGTTESGCGLYPLEGDELVPAESVFSSAGQQGDNAATNFGNRVMRCEGYIPNTTGKAIKLDYRNTGAECFADGLETDNWRQIVTPDGRTTLVCNAGKP